MRNYLKEILIIVIQIVMFYMFPLFAGPTDAMGMVLIIILSTMLLSFILGFKSINKVKFLYPLIIAILFIPSVYIYYNESALVHSFWYLIVSVVGILCGIITKFIFNKIINK